MSRRRSAWPRRAALSLAMTAAVVVAGVTGCGGGENPLDNPPSVANPGGAGGQKLSFAYFQRCVYPILVTDLTIQIGSVVSTNSCAGGGCHDNTTGTGGAFRTIPGQTPIVLPLTTLPTATVDAIRATDMYKNFYSAQGSAIVGSATQSRLLTKPLVQGVLHGGGLVFANLQDVNAKVLQYWINNPSPRGQDEFSIATHAMFTAADPNTGTCISQ
jgi:hypothetical protein